MIRNKINHLNIPDGNEYCLASVNDALYVLNNIFTRGGQGVFLRLNF